jgi:hypothetical protein
MSNSPFKELFGEYEGSVGIEREYVSNETRTQVHKVRTSLQVDGKFKTFLGFYLSVIVVCLTFLSGVWYFNAGNFEKKSEVRSVSDVRLPVVNEIAEETPMDSFIQKFVNNSYKVASTGSFAYVYKTLENDVEQEQSGLISMGEDSVYFQDGQTISFDIDGDLKVLWDDYERKHILFKDEGKYFLVSNSTPFYYRNYLGQHILQDLVNDYFKNKDFIVQLDEETWVWDWFFFIPIEQSYKHKMKAEIILDLDSGLLKQIRLLDGSVEVGVFEFSFEKSSEPYDVSKELLEYEKVQESTLDLGL